MYTIINFFDPWYYGRLDPARVPNTVKYAIRWPLRIFLLSFILGSLLFLFYLLSKNFYLVVIGFYYVCTAIALNLAVLIALIIMAVQYNTFSGHILKKTSILLLNIPIAMLYLIVLSEI